MTPFVCRINRGVQSAVVAVAAVAAMCTTSWAQPCEPEWTPMGAGTQTGAAVNAVRAMTVFNDGTGEALYIGGQFQSVDGVAATNIAKWNGSTWSPVGGGVNGTVFTMAVFDDGLGGGPALYAAGSFTQAGGAPASRIAKWNGTAWSPLGTGITGSAVTAMCVFDDGAGPDLYVGGNISAGNGVPIYKIGRWDGTTFSPLGNGIGLPPPASPIVYALAAFDDGSGPALYAAGAFTTADGAAIPADRIARWDGSAWSSVFGGLSGQANALAVHNDGSGPALYVGGEFIGAGVDIAMRMARWDGEAWAPVGAGMDDGSVNALAVFDDGSGGGPKLYASGSFTGSGGSPMKGVAVWDGATWSAVASGFDDGEGLALAGFDGGTPTLYAGGSFTAAGGASTSRIAQLLCNPVGACCLPSGVCEPRTQIRCAIAGASYSGDGIDCMDIDPCTPASTGACCTPMGCVVTWNAGEGGCIEQGGVYLGDGSVCGTDCDAIHFEIEDNSNKALAQTVVLGEGDSIVGVSTANGSGEPGADYFRVHTAAAPLAIYEHQMTLSTTGPVGHSTRIVSANQTTVAAGTWPCDIGTPVEGTDSNGGQTGGVVGTDRVNYWYGFGKEEGVYYHVWGTDATTGLYISTLTTTEVVPTDLGTFLPGELTITTTGQGHTSDTHLMILDEDLVAIPGYGNDRASINGGAPANSTNTSFLRRQYEPGTYYMAIGIINLASTVGKACDDNRRFGAILDLPDAVVATDNSAVTNVSFAVTDSAGTTGFAASRPGRARAAWFRFTVGDAPCPADFDGNGTVAVPDIFAFLATWFASGEGADFDDNGTIAVPDIFAFLSAWFAGCP